MKVKIFALLLLVFLQSCKSKKEILYMQDINAYNNTKANYTNATLQPNDILKITVGALVPETAIPYNRIVPTVVQGNTPEMMQLEGYLVSLEQTISFPILGEISVTNKTITQLETDLINRLESGGHLVNPSVNVRLLNAKVTILGEVNRPGTYTFTENNINLLQAFGLAGDLTINGVRDDVVLIREIDGVRTIAHFDLTKSDWLDSPYYLIKPNDVIMVNPNGAKVKTAGYIGNISTLLAVTSLLVTTIILINTL
ncbi:polysaccharide biosynthesis/export family protein [Patiriisocius sp. Uisw_017]|jgi:polysaccharide export outer membrane protein|uniref:polysaccharide biosynthesis/export family protein n=1 Tax=Patiriisocius sp. Uisw_017 TaxID=3230968 RepID=UPI0039ED25E6